MNKVARYVVIFPKPKDEKAFMDHYRSHRELASKIPNVKEITDMTVAQHDMPTNVMNPYFISVVEFDNLETLVESMSSEAGKALMADYQGPLMQFFTVSPICFTTTDGLPIPIVS